MYVFLLSKGYVCIVYTSYWVSFRIGYKTSLDNMISSGVILFQTRDLW